MTRNAPRAARAPNAPKALRPVDLARMAGVSTQLVRDYADAGILPPTPRTATGYRRFAPVHGRALLAYRALAKGFGPDRARAVMRAVHADDVPEALTLLDAAHAELHAQREALRATGAALEAVASEGPGTAPAPPPRAPLTVGEVAARVGVRTSALRVWEAAGLLAPERERGTGYRLYAAADVRDARMITMLRQAGHPLPAIRPVLDGLRETGSSEALRAALARRGEELTRRSGAMLAASSLLHGYVTGEPQPDGPGPAPTGGDAGGGEAGGTGAQPWK
ncbi:MerR family transcriptional regulator [Streptomyces silvensis]|uniref:MerR family transcriptional regulator n=1 Tax=Streptomyces silvensis TaxID=1765722 RepID=A0A0W7X335_9ACTN|nr:MerR family transcriptional regulator [Streptomyces silvensis]KUF17280.1 MerR family transcriptional regulator [Streptomyces silvensis]